MSFFGSKIVDYLILVFSAGDVLEDDGITLEEYLSDCPNFLKRVVRLCGQRMIVFDTETEDEAKKTKQVHDLLELIDLVKKQNNNIPYTNDMYHNIKEENDRYKKEQEELESKGYLREKLEALNMELQLMNQHNLKAMAEMMERNIKTEMKVQEKLFEKAQKLQEKLFEEIMEQSYFEGVNNATLRELERNINELEEQMSSSVDCAIL